MNTSLYEIAGSYRAISDRLHDLDLDEQTIADTLEGVGGDLQEKSVNVAKYFRNLEAMADQIKQAESQMSARRKAIEKRAASLKEYLKTNMERAGISKIESPWFAISIKQNPESVHVDDETAIPRDYFREIPVSYQLDKVLCKQAIKDGYEIPGCHLEHGTRLDIK
jgi:Siphovirus Gp157